MQRAKRIVLIYEKGEEAVHSKNQVFAFNQPRLLSFFPPSLPQRYMPFAVKRLLATLTKY